MDNESAFLDLAEIVFKDELFPLVFMAEDPEVVPNIIYDPRTGLCVIDRYFNDCHVLHALNDNNLMYADLEELRQFAESYKYKFSTFDSWLNERDHIHYIINCLGSFARNSFAQKGKIYILFDAQKHLIDFASDSYLTDIADVFKGADLHGASMVKDFFVDNVGVLSASE